MMQHIKQNLLELDHIVSQLNDGAYAQKLAVLSNSSIGQHTRHILELFTCLISPVVDDEVNYDARKRDMRLETDPNFARQTIRLIISRLDCISNDKELVLCVNYSQEEREASLLKTSMFRELAYNLEHSVHHQALIKIGLSHLSNPIMVSENFGVAAVTIRYRKTACAQ